jgi:UDP-3-O-[3-hydroxymyristoyl] glucosamine N-acyltransferase
MTSGIHRFEIIPLQPLRAGLVTERFKLRMVGPDLEIACARPLRSLCPGAISFASRRGAAAQRGVGAVVIVRPGFARADGNCYIEHENPRLLFALIMAEFFESVPSASIAPDSTISSNVKISTGVQIGSRVVIEDDVRIGEGTQILHGAIIFSGTHIGRRCVIGPGVVLGTTGFGFERDATGNPVRVPHFGGLILGDDVHVGANSTIARGVIEDTVIGDQTKIGPQVNIAHNVSVGRQCLITGQSQISGSAEIGDRCWLGPNCTIRRCRIGDGVTVGLGTVVLADIADNTSVFATSSYGAPSAQNVPRQDDPAGAPKNGPVLRQEVAIEQMIRHVLDLPTEFELRDDLTMTEVPSWDSLAHMNIVMEAQKISGLKLKLEAMARIRSIGDLKAELANAAWSSR